ncbi:MAG TPA: CAP domain-containing protein [Pirellulaceae bacterium]|nr:CAP domain-containing protein [Pirellulaceae bacterium]
MKFVLSFCAVGLVLASSWLMAEETTKAAETETGAAVTATKEEPKEEAKEKEVAKPAPLHEHPTLLRMLGRNNELRRRVGLRPHRINPLLTKAAQDHAVYMARTGNFSHYSNGGPQGRASRWGFGSGVRENIAMGQSDVGSAFNSWQNSSGHWASIVSGTTDAGFGYAVDRGGRGYWVAVYGTDYRQN